MPSFQPGNGYSFVDSTTAGRTIATGKPEASAICSPIALVYVYVFGNPQNWARSMPRSANCPSTNLRFTFETSASRTLPRAGSPRLCRFFLASSKKLLWRKASFERCRACSITSMHSAISRSGSQCDFSSSSARGNGNSRGSDSGTWPVRLPATKQVLV